jgi:hypothetical protein
MQAVKQRDGHSCGLHAIRNTYLALKYNQSLSSSTDENIITVLEQIFLDTYSYDVHVKGRDRDIWYNNIEVYMDAYSLGTLHDLKRESFIDLEWNEIQGLSSNLVSIPVPGTPSATIEVASNISKRSNNFLLVKDEVHVSLNTSDKRYACIKFSLLSL